MRIKTPTTEGKELARKLGTHGGPLTPEAKRLAEVLEMRTANVISELLALPKRIAVRVARTKTPEGVKKLLDRELRRALRGLDEPLPRIRAARKTV